MIDRINTSIAIGVDKATKKAADAIGKVNDSLAGKADNAVDNGILIRLNSAYAENYLQARNAQDSISYMQYRDATLGSVSDRLQDLRDLSLSMGNPALNDSDKALITQQANGILEDINSLSGTEYNSHSIVGDVTLDSLGLSNLDFGSDGTISAVDNALSYVNTKRLETGGTISTLNARIDNLSAQNVNLAEAAEGYTGSLEEDITEMHLAVTQAMVSMKALDAVMELDKNKVMSLVDMIEPVKDEKEDENTFAIKDKDDK